MSDHHPDDPEPAAPVARIRDAVMDAYTAAVAEHAPDGAGVGLVMALQVLDDAGSELAGDTRTGVVVDLERMTSAGVDTGNLGAGDVIAAMLGALIGDVRDAAYFDQHRN